MHPVTALLYFLTTKITWCQVFKKEAFSIVTTRKIGNSSIYYNMTLTGEMGCARLCGIQSERCTGFLYKGTDCLLVSGNSTESVIMLERDLKGFVFYSQYTQEGNDDRTLEFARGK